MMRPRSLAIIATAFAPAADDARPKRIGAGLFSPFSAKHELTPIFLFSTRGAIYCFGGKESY
jgi:hypothetical protein